MNPSTHELTLTGLREDNPRDFLAALGLLRMLGLLWPNFHSVLSWQQSGTPVIGTVNQLPFDWGDQIWDRMVRFRKSDHDPFKHGKIEGITVTEFRELLEGDYRDSPFHAMLYPALMAQVPKDKMGRRSEFIIESASRSVLNGIGSLLDRNKNIPSVAADFAGTGSKFEVSNTSRWNPAEYQAAAYMAADPQDSNLMDFVSLNIFSLIGLTFYPTVDTVKGRRTCGIERNGKTMSFSWPVWDAPLGSDEIGTLLLHPEVHAAEYDKRSILSLGVRQVWTSRKFKPDGKNDYFSTAHPKL